MTQGGFFSRLFGLDKTNSNTSQENRTEGIVNNNTVESTKATLQDTVNFIAELQSYYYNDICKMQSDLVVQTYTPSEEKRINKKIKQDQIALAQIDEILELVRQNEREHQSIWRKSVYSFYDEIEAMNLVVIQEKVFKIVIKLCAINTKQELNDIIFNRIQKYKTDWNISDEIQIPENSNVILVDGDESTETYSFGKFRKTVNISENDRTLTSEQLNKIRALEFEFEDAFSTDEVWVYVGNATRLQLNFMRRTCIIDNTWENTCKDKLELDVIKVNDLSQYLKGILQLVFAKNAYAIISIVIPSDDMLKEILPIEKKEGKVEILRKHRFYLRERSGLYKNNLVTARINIKKIPESVQFISYLKFKDIYF